MTILPAETPLVLDATRDGAWDAVVAMERQSGQLLYGYALRLGIDPGRASDLVQESLLRLWRELGKGTVVGSHEAWTYRAIARLAMDEHRLHQRLAGLVTRLGDRITTRATEPDPTDRVAVWTRIDRLPDRQRAGTTSRMNAQTSWSRRSGPSCWPRGSTGPRRVRLP